MNLTCSIRHTNQYATKETYIYRLISKGEKEVVDEKVEIKKAFHVKKKRKASPYTKHLGHKIDNANVIQFTILLTCDILQVE